VILFLPGEPFFAAALARDPELIERGIDRRVLVAGPTTLIALLRAIAYGWQQESLTENAREVARLGRELFERIATLNERFGSLGRKLDGAVEAYNAAIGSFESRVQVSARRMAELGVAKSPELPELTPLERRAKRPAEPPPASPSA
jgi:DNA recombination protein RmuC